MCVGVALLPFITIQVVAGRRDTKKKPHTLLEILGEGVRSAMQEGGQAVLRVGADDVHVVWEVDRVGGNYLAPRCVENRCFGGEGNDVEHFTIIPKRQGCLVACPVPVDTFDLHNPAFQPLLGSGGNADLWENAVEVEYQIENIYQRTTCQHSVIEIRERKQFAAIMQKKLDVGFL